jgi:hypothetical protein
MESKALASVQQKLWRTFHHEYSGAAKRFMVRRQSATSTRASRAAREFAAEEPARVRASVGIEQRSRVYIAAENRLLREALSRMLVKQGDIDVVGLNCAGPFRVEGLLEEQADILLAAGTVNRSANRAGTNE